jgi:heme exporter protein A
LACRRGEDLLFKDFSFEIHENQLVWLKGENGRGKTSLLRLIVGLSEPDFGSLAWRIASREDHESHKDKLVYIGHKNALKNDLTVAESLGFLAKLHGRTVTAQYIESALRILALQHRSNALVRTLSQGQRRRVALARLGLETIPSLWVLDEPFDSLDTQGTEIVNHLILQHIARGGSVMLTSHAALQIDASVVTPLELPVAIQP